MKDFTKGALFVVGAALFGKYMYERGGKDERNKCAKELNDFVKELDNDMKCRKEKEKEESQ